MADRKLVTLQEERNPEGPYWTLEVQRSAAGVPGLLVTISREMFDPGYDRLNQELTFVVEDGWELVSPIIQWLDGEGSGEL